MKTKNIKQILTSTALAAAMLLQTAAVTIAAATDVELSLSRIVDSTKTSGAAFTDESTINNTAYVLLKFAPGEFNADGLGSAKINLTISDKENAKALYLDEIPSDWNGKSATKWSTTYGNAEWKAKVTEKAATATSAAGAVSFDVTENFKAQMSAAGASAVYYALHTDDTTGFTVTKSSVKLVIEQAATYTNFNSATEGTIAGLVEKYITGESAGEYKKLEDKSFVNAKLLARTDYTSLEDVENELAAALTEYHIDLINKADESTVGGLMSKYLSAGALTEYNKLSDKSEVDAKMAERSDYETIAEIESALSAAVAAYNKSHAYLNEEGWFAVVAAADYANADINQQKAGTGYSTVGAYNNSTRPMFKFDLRSIDLDNARSIKVSYNTQKTMGDWYTYDPTAAYTTNLVVMHSDWKSAGIAYDKSYFAQTTVAGTAYKTDKGTYGTLTADVTEDVKSRGKGADYISYYLMVQDPCKDGFKSTNSYTIDGTCDIKLLVEYPNDAECVYSANITDGESAVSVDKDIVITLPKNASAESATADNIVVTEAGAEINTYKLTVDGAKLTIKINGGMKYNTAYTVKLKSNLQLSGDSLHYYFAPLGFKTDVEDFENDGQSVVQGGAAIDSLNGVTGTVTAKTRLKNNKLGTQSMVVTLILIEETEHGDVTRGIKVCKYTLEKGQEANVTENFTLSGGKYRIECMVWDSFSGRVTRSAESLQ